jgi:glycosyltransferase involved in cell wall biosynthesis
MNVLQICANYPPVPGGHGVYAQNLSLELSKCGVNTTIMTFNPKKYASIKVADKLPVIRTKAFFLESIEYPVYSPTFLFNINEVVKKYEIDVINSHTRFFTSTFFSAIYKKLNQNVLLVHTEHGAGPLVHNNNYVSSISNFYDSTFGKWAIKAADIPIAIGPSSMKFMRRLGCTHNIEIIPNSIDCKGFTELQIKDGKKNIEQVVITYIGRLVESKGVSDLIHVFSEIENYYNIKLWIVGSGPDETMLKELAQLLAVKNIEFLGFREDIAKILSFTDIFVSPSHYDSVPTTLLEAGCLAKRIVATNVGDVSYILGDDYEYMFEAKSLNTLKNHLIKIIEEDAYDAYDVQKRIFQLFDWNKNSKKYYSILKDYL